MKTLRLTLLGGMMFFAICVCQVLAAEPRTFLSTSGLIPVSYKNHDGIEIKTCNTKKAVFGSHYVTIRIDKLTVNKNDSFLYRVFNWDRHAFGAVSLKANYKTQQLSVSKVGRPIALSGSESSVDMSVDWQILDRVPWVLRNPTLDIKLGYAADSALKALTDAFTGITSAIPDYTISSSLATGFAITNAIDKLLFGPDRARDLLGAQLDIPLQAEKLCEGYYATFGAENKTSYEKYYDDRLVWSGKDLQHGGTPIKDVSYGVVSFHIQDRFYPIREAALNDNDRSWSTKYREVITSLFDLTWIKTSGDITQMENRIRENLLAARTLLVTDLDLIQQEKLEIHRYALTKAQEALNTAKARVSPGGMVTKTSTERALMSAVNMANFVHPNSVNLATQILKNPEENISDLPEEVATSLKNAFIRIEYLLSLK